MCPGRPLPNSWSPSLTPEASSSAKTATIKTAATEAAFPVVADIAGIALTVEIAVGCLVEVLPSRVFPARGIVLLPIAVLLAPVGIAILAGKDIVLSQAGGIIMKCAPIRCRMIHFGIGMIGFPA